MDTEVFNVYLPVRTLIAPCKALGSPHVKASMRRLNNSGHVSGQSQWAIADTAYATLVRTLLIDSFRPAGRISRIAHFA